MPSESSTSIIASHRDRTVVVTFWVLGVVAMIELAFAAVALAPRIAAGLKSPTQASSATMDTSNPLSNQLSATASQPASGIQNPITQSSPVQSMMGDATERPIRQLPSDAAAPQGASLQILNARLEGGEDGSKALQIAIKARPRENIDVPQVKVQVFFYDEENGELVPSKAQVTSKWMSTPVDWKGGEPELLEVRYILDSVDPETRFAGYVVALYYKGDRQDCRANPTKLEKLFEPKYFIGLDDQ